MFRAVKSFQEDYLKVKIYKNRWELGYSAGIRAINTIQNQLGMQEKVHIVFATTPSQKVFLDTLASAEDVDWSRVTAFHIEEYLGLPQGEPQLTSCYLRDRFFSLVKPGRVYYLNANRNPEGDCKKYTELLLEKKIDMVCMGIGENGHIALNTPLVADFMDTETIKPVQLEYEDNQQKTGKGFGSIPTCTLTLTVPALMSGSEILCIVSEESKRNAVKQMINGPISTDCPASILRLHPSCTLFLDTDCYGKQDMES